MTGITLTAKVFSGGSRAFVLFQNIIGTLQVGNISRTQTERELDIEIGFGRFGCSMRMTRVHWSRIMT